MTQNYDTCPYCEQPTAAISTTANYLLTKCVPCRTWYHYDLSRGLHIFTLIYFKIKERTYKLSMYPRENRMRLSFVMEVSAPSLETTLIEASRIPDWTPQNIVEKVTPLLPFI